MSVKNTVDIKNGLLTLLIGFVLFLSIFIFSRVLNLEAGIRLSIYFCAAALFAFNVPGRKNLSEKKNESLSVTNENSSDLLIWLAAPFDDKSARNTDGSQKFTLRKFLIVFLMLLPFLIIEFVQIRNDILNKIKDQSYHGVDAQPYGGINAGPTISSINKQADSIKHFSVLLKLNDAKELYEKGKFIEALDYCNKMKPCKDTSFSIFIANCFLNLKQNDSACYYWSVAKQEGCVKADSLISANCNKKK